jgi:hypothetical protein
MKISELADLVHECQVSPKIQKPDKSPNQTTGQKVRFQRKPFELLSTRPNSVEQKYDAEATHFCSPFIAVGGPFC